MLKFFSSYFRERKRILKSLKIVVQQFNIVKLGNLRMLITEKNNLINIFISSLFKVSRIPVQPCHLSSLRFQYRQHFSRINIKSSLKIPLHDIPNDVFSTPITSLSITPSRCCSGNSFSGKAESHNTNRNR